MNELSKFLVESILEDDNPIKKTVVIYVGRFQPMHKGHYGTYQHLVKKFGKNNVYVGTSDKVELPKSPFNFKEKVKIANAMFGIPKNKIFKVKNPYKPTEILSKFDKKTTAFVTVVGEKDKSRLGMGAGRYFQPYKGEPTEGYEDRGYVYVAPQSGGGISGTETRNGLSVGSDDQKKDFFKKRAYGKFNATIFKMITDKLNEDLEVKKEWIYDSLTEISSTTIGGGDVDDGPNIVYPSADLFKKMSIERAAQIGFDVVGDILGGQESIDKTDYRVYGDGPVGAVSFFPAGVIGNMTPNNQVDIYSKGAYAQWYQHATRTASLVGYEVVKGLGVHKDDAKQAGDDAKGAKELEKEFETSLKENIVLPVKVGDTILTGRFKNKKVKVKTIGKDEHGMPTINGKKVVTFRLMKEHYIAELAGTEVKCEKCNHQWEIESDDDEKYLCHSCGYDSQKGEYDFDAFDSWQEKNGMLDERSKGKLRPADLLRRKAAMAGKRAAIARRRKRTMNRRKPLSKLKKIAYKKAYLEVYKEFMEDLFPGVSKSDLSIQQAKIVHKNVLRKKKRVIKRAKFKFLPQLRDAEAQKFGQKDEMSKSTLNKIEKFAEKKLSPEDIEFTKHFFDRVNDPRNGKEISDAELTGFFKRLSKYKKKFKEFLEKYQQIVVTDKRHDINIPFVKQANQIIAKTVMRKKNFQTSNPKLAFEDSNPNAHPQGSKKISARTTVMDMLDVISHKEFRGKDFEKLSTSEKKKVISIAKKHKFVTENKNLSEAKQVGVIYHYTDKKGLDGILKSNSIKSNDEHYLGNVINYISFTRNKNFHKKGMSFGVKLEYRIAIDGNKLSNRYKIKPFAYIPGWDYTDSWEYDWLDDEPESVRRNFFNATGEYDEQEERITFKKPSKIGNIKSYIIKVDKISDLKANESVLKENINESKLLMEGGAYGHMSHPFDTDINLTFGQLKDIVNRALEGTLEFTREKTDGQALAISWRDGRLVAARNKGHLKNKGENALDIKGVSDKFQGRGGLSDAYNYAMKDLSNAISSLSEKQRDKIFKQGACFMNLEVIYPTSVNVIPYGQALLVFHGTMEYNDEGVAIGENGEAARILAGMIKQVNKDVQDNYTIQGPPVVKLPKSTDLSKKKGKYSSQISKLQKEFKLKDTDGVANYHQAWWEQWVDKNSPSSLDNKTKMGLVKRWAFMDKKFRLDNKNISDSKTLEWAKKTDKDDHKKISKQNLMKFEQIFLGLGAEVLEFTSSALTVNPDAAVRDIKKRIDKTIKDVKKSGDPKKIEKLKLELGRLNSIGGSKKIVPNEGIVFLYKGNTFKLTGTFASVNQILGIFF